MIERLTSTVTFCGRHALLVGLLLAITSPQYAEEHDVSEAELEHVTEEIVVTGSRIRRDNDDPTAVLRVDAAELERTGLTNLGDALQNLPISGSAPNAQFNMPGNTGFPQDGAGIGAGSVQLSLRNLGAKRTLVLVNGRRWIAGSSASGVPSTVDLNTIPDNAIARIEVLADGASAIYGSDAISGVVNIITDSDFEGLALSGQTGGYLDFGDGGSDEFNLKWGAGSDKSHVVVSASWQDEGGINTADRERSAFPNPNVKTCDVPGSRCSSFTPQGRFIFGPAYANGASVTLNDGVLNDGGANIPRFDPTAPDAHDFHTFTAADRFNYNGPGFNYLRTPNERRNAFLTAEHLLASNLRLFGTISHTTRESATKGAPEPLCFGSGCGTDILENFVISALNPYNPFGVDLSVADGTMVFFGRRPLESGQRLFFQEAKTLFATLGIEGETEWRNRAWHWELTSSFGRNRASQTKYNSHNAARLQLALGDPATCAQTPGCVPFNFFGGQGPDGTGSLTRDMLDFVTYTQYDHSQQELRDVVFEIGGDLFSVPAGSAALVAGIERRSHSGWFRPDPIAERAETAGVPAGATDGEFSATEVFSELVLPLVDNGSSYWNLNLALRHSNYSTFGSEFTYKIGTLFKPLPPLSLRGSMATGFRAPGIGELFGGTTIEHFVFVDPCSDVLGMFASVGGRDTPQPADIIENCASLGVPQTYVQPNPQHTAISTGNRSLTAETSESFSAGIAWDSFTAFAWAEKFSASLDYHQVEITDAVQGRSPGEVLLACVDTLDPTYCALTPRAASGTLGIIENPLQNIGGIDASGFDVQVGIETPATKWGNLRATVNATLLREFSERIQSPTGEDSVFDRTGTHTNETFQRAFPELRWVADLAWQRNQWLAALSFRGDGELTLDTGQPVDRAMFTDLRLSRKQVLDKNTWTLTMGFNNLFDEDPPLCFPCSVLGLSQVLHDLPGRVGYVRVSLRRGTND